MQRKQLSSATAFRSTLVWSVEIGNGARHSQQFKATARAQAALVDQLFPELECRCLDGSALPQPRGPTSSRWWPPAAESVWAREARLLSRQGQGTSIATRFEERERLHSVKGQGCSP